MDQAAIFSAALEKQDPEERRVFLQAACGEDRKLLARVEGLLWAHEHPDTFLEDPVARVVNGNREDQQTVTCLAPNAEKPGTQIGPYKLLQLVGEGGMGSVWMAEQQEPVRRRVALKLIKRGMDSRQILARFEAERQALSMMDHPNIAKVLDAGTAESGRPYFAMELVKGEPITQYCDEHHLSPSERLELFLSVCHAIQHAHQKGIIHRDIKPSNVLVAEYDGRPVTKVIDFGVAKAVHQPLTEKTMFTGLGQIIGTLEYMSPEQARVNQLDIDTRSDVYSLGVLLYELLTGSTPFDKQRMREAALDELLRIIREEEPPRPSMKLSSSETLPSIAANRKTEPARLSTLVRGELDWIVMKALEKDRNQRYETANGFAMDIRRYLAGEPVLAAPRSVSYRLRKFVRRNRAAVVAGSLVAAALIVAVAGTSSGMLWALQERREAELQRNRAEQREEEAIQAVRRFGDAVANNYELKNRPELEALRKTLLQEPLSLFKSLGDQLREDADTRPEALARLATAAFELGFLTNQIGKIQDSLVAYQQAREIQEVLVRNNPTVTQYQSDLAATLNDSGILLAATGKREQALDAYREALAIRERIARRDPACTANRLDLVRSHNNIGNLLADTGHFNEALASCQQALQHCEQLARDNPADTQYQRFMAACHQNIGILQRQSGKPEEALASCRQALAIWENLVQSNPTATEYQSGLAGSLRSIGVLLKQTGKQEEALACYQQSIAIGENLVRDYPSVTRYQSELAAGHYNLGLLYSDSGNLNDALAAYQQALVIRERLVREDPQSTNNQSSLALVHNVIGDHFRALGRPEEAMSACRQALAIRERLVQADPTSTQNQNDLAASYSSLGLLLADAGQVEEALAAYQRARDLLFRLVQQGSALPEDQHALANSCQRIGQLLAQTDQQQEALAAYRQALETRQALVRSVPNSNEYKKGLASCRNQMGVLYAQIHQPDNARSAFEQALVIQEKLVQDDPAVTEYQSSVGGTLSNMALLDLEEKRFEQAKDKLMRAIDYQRHALAANPNHSTYRAFLMNHYTNLSQAAQQLGDQALRLEARRRLLDLARPTDGSITDSSARALNDFVWEMVKDPHDAHPRVTISSELAELRRAVESFSQGTYFNTLGVAEYRMGNYQAAITAATKSIELFPAEANLPAPHPIDLAIIAMSHRRLGQTAEAEKFHVQFDETMKLDAYKEDAECQSFAAELKQAFANPPDAADLE